MSDDSSSNVDVDDLGEVGVIRADDLATFVDTTGVVGRADMLDLVMIADVFGVGDSACGGVADTNDGHDTVSA
jgi:hypothetical protein